MPIVIDLGNIGNITISLVEIYQRLHYRICWSGM